MSVTSGKSPVPIFDLAVGYLHAGDFDSLAPLLHDQVILEHLHSNGRTEFGRDNAIQALKACGATMENAKPSWDNHNCVSGTADWVWGKGGRTEPIRFSFLFTDDGSHTNWQIHHLYSVLDSA